MITGPRRSSNTPCSPSTITNPNLPLFPIHQENLYNLPRGFRNIVSAGPIAKTRSFKAVDLDIAHTFNTRAHPKGAVGSSQYKYAIAVATKAGKKLVPGKFYVFTIEWNTPSFVEDTSESKREREKPLPKLGFEHVAVVAGGVIANNRGGDAKVADLDFDAIR